MVEKSNEDLNIYIEYLENIGLINLIVTIKGLLIK